MKITISLIIMKQEDKVYIMTNGGAGIMAREGKQKEVAKKMKQTPGDMIKEGKPFALNQIFAQHEKAVWQLPDSFENPSSILTELCHKEDGNYIILNQSTFFEQRSGIMVKPELSEKMWEDAEKL